MQALINSATCDECASQPTADMVGEREQEFWDWEARVRGCVACTAKRASTYVWIDIFCVNQHLRSPHGGFASVCV